MIKVLALVGLLFLILIIGPIATIYSLNTLFPSLAIPLTFETWIAVIILGGVIRGDGLTFRSNK
jgi:hypothetical protein